MRILKIDHVALSVRNLESSVQWYRDVLGLEVDRSVAWEGPPIMMTGGTGAIALFQNSKLNREIESLEVQGFRHVALAVERSDFEQAKAELTARNIVYEFQDHGRAISLYVSDPDGYEIEITTPTAG